jgi:hypothetical protein
MKQAWCLASNLTAVAAKALMRLYGKRWSIECGDQHTTPAWSPRDRRSNWTSVETPNAGGQAEAGGRLRSACSNVCAARKAKPAGDWLRPDRIHRCDYFKGQFVAVAAGLAPANFSQVAVVRRRRSGARRG